MVTERRTAMTDILAIPLSRPSITDVEREAVLQVLATGRLSQGEWITAFEDAFRAYLGIDEAVAVSSGTAGLQIAVRTLDLQPDDEVVTTPFTFIATASVLCHERLRPVFCDIDPRTLNIDPAQVERAITPATKALMVVDIFGSVPDMPALLAIAARHGLPVIEDACEALGANLGGRKAGTFGRSAVFGFYPNKQITTGEGGMVVTADPELAARFRQLRNHGRPGKAMQFEEVGFNFRLNELAAALGKVQLDRIETILAMRRLRADWYREALAGMPEVVCMPGGEERSPFIFYVLLRDRRMRDGVLNSMNDKGIETSIYFPPLHLERAFQFLGHRLGDFPVTEDSAGRILALPFWTAMPREVVDAVVAGLRESIAEMR